MRIFDNCSFSPFFVKYNLNVSLRLSYSTVLYTGGIRGDRINENGLIL
jgi:hypothetical protein